MHAQYDQKLRCPPEVAFGTWLPIENLLLLFLTVPYKGYSFVCVCVCGGGGRVTKGLRMCGPTFQNPSHLYTWALKIGPHIHILTIQNTTYTYTSMAHRIASRKA